MNTFKSTTTFNRTAAWMGVIGPIVFILIVIILGTQYEGYSHLSQAVSELGAVDSPVQLWQTLNFIAFGTMLAIFALGFHQQFAGSSKLTTGLLLYFAIFAGIGNGIFPCAPGCEMATTNGIVHNLTGLTGFISLSVGLILIGRRMRQFPVWSQWATYTQLSACCIIAFFLLWFIAGPIGGVWPHIQGLFQRLMILSFLQWFAAMGIFLGKQPVAQELKQGAVQL